MFIKTDCFFIRLDELSSVVRLERPTTEDSSCRQIMRLVPVFTLGTNNETNNECLPKFAQTDNASSIIKTAIDDRNLRLKGIPHRTNCKNILGNLSE